MASSVTVSPVRGVRGTGLFAIIIGIVMIVAGAVTYGMVTSQLRDENITVSDDASPSFLAGKRVQDPFTAYAQAEVINKHALAATGGKTFAELSQDDPRRATVMNGSFLRASLFTSVVAFGVSVLVVVLGVLFLLLGIALRRLGRGDVTVLDVVPAGGGSVATAPVAPVTPTAPAAAAPVAPVVPPVRDSVQSATPGAAARAAAAEVEHPAPPVEVPAESSAPPVQANPVQANPVQPADDVPDAGPGPVSGEPGEPTDGRRPEL